MNDIRYSAGYGPPGGGGYGPPPGYGPPGGYSPSPYGYGPPPPTGPQQKTNALAVVSLVTGICALVCGLGSWVCCFLVFLAAPLAFILSAVSIPTGLFAMSQIKQSNGALRGNGMALAGLITGIVALVPTVLWVILIGYSALTSP
ncbi:MAG TPA: DUF4190 domain-containing protein [Polyangiaceae bacterium]|jgi:hypothetical protein